MLDFSPDMLYDYGTNKKTEKVILMKKALCAVIAIVICMALLFTGCKDDSTPGSIVDNSSPEQYAQGTVVKSDIKIEEVGAAENVSEESLVSICAEAELFRTNRYYLEGTIYSGDQKMPVILATDGKNIQLTATMSGISFGVLVLDDTTYVIQPSSKVYTELSDLLVKTLGIDDLNVSEFQGMGEGENENSVVKQTAVTINGDAGVCTDFIYDDTSIKLYSIGDKLIQVESLDEKGNISMQIVVDYISAQIPSDQLTLKGLTKTNIPSFLSSFMNIGQ